MFYDKYVFGRMNYVAGGSIIMIGCTIHYAKLIKAGCDMPGQCGNAFHNHFESPA